jgi:uncharacterized repeat protein (TIGR01451 family)
VATPQVVTHQTPTSAPIGSTISDTATVTGVSGGPTPGGTVTFRLYNNGMCTGTVFGSAGPVTLAPDAGSSPPSASASGSLTAPSPPGTYYWQVTYSGDTDYGSALSVCDTEPVDVGVAAAQVVTAQTPAPPASAAVGSTINDTATVTGVSGGPTPGGTVTFALYNNDMCTGTVFGSAGPVTLVANLRFSPPSASASASLTAPSPPGTYYWQVTYSGDTNYGSALSDCATEPVDVGVAAAHVTTAETPAPAASAAVGSTISDTATVTGVSGGPTPSGTVIFQLFDNPTCSGTVFGSDTDVPLVALVGSSPPAASATGSLTAPSPPGTYFWHVTYTGDTSYGSALSGCDSEPVDVGVAAAQVTTAQTPAPPASATVGSTIADTATVTGVSGGPTPGGTVTFQLFDNAMCTGTVFGTDTDVALAADAGSSPPSASASGSVTAPSPPGTYFWLATYSGDTNYGLALSVCTDEPLDVGVATPSVITTQSPMGTVAAGSPIHDTATVTGVNGVPAPSGSVTFQLFDNASCSGSPLLTAGTIGLSATSPAQSPPTATATSNTVSAPTPPGTYYWVVTYGGDPNFDGATSDCALEPVTVRPIEVSLSVAKTSSPNPYTPGKPLTYTIVVRNGGPDAAAPATVDDPLTQLQGAGFIWTCVATIGSTCGAPSGGTPLHDTPTIAAGGSVTYTVTGIVPVGTTGVLTNTVTADPPPGASDPGCDPNCTATNVNPTPATLATVASPTVTSPTVASPTTLALTGASLISLLAMATVFISAGLALIALTRRRNPRHHKHHLTASPGAHARR